MPNWTDHILIFQMGKVASTAIAEALRQRGLSVLQAHVAAPERLYGKLEILTGAQVSEIVASRMYADYLQELEATFILARHKVSDTVDGGKLKIISLTRSPLSWYWSHFAQNYDHYQSILERYHSFHYGSKTKFVPEEVLYEVQSIFFDVIDQSLQPIDDPDALNQLMIEADFRDPTNVVFNQLNRFLLPLRWFGEDFLPATDVDVYSYGFDSTCGVGYIETAKLSILLIRYEDLQASSNHIAQFVGLDSFVLKHTNISIEKKLPIDLKEMQRVARERIPQTLLNRISGTLYARHFGYNLEGNC